MKQGSAKSSQGQTLTPLTKQLLICHLGLLQKSISSAQSSEEVVTLLQLTQLLCMCQLTQDSGTESEKSSMPSMLALTDSINCGPLLWPAVKAWWGRSVASGLLRWAGINEES